MNPHTPHPDEDPNAPGRPDGTPGDYFHRPRRRLRGHSPGPRRTCRRGTAPLSAGRPVPLLWRPVFRAHPAALPRRPAGRGPQPQNFFDWVRSHGIHRGRERWIGGVASGIAQRLGVDPLIVRGILIVLTVFAGVGVLLYGLAWALLPEPDGRIHVQEAAAGRWSSGMTGALITTIIGLPQPGQRRLGLGPLRFRRLRLDGVLGGRRHLRHLLPDPAQQGPRRRDPMSPGRGPGGAGWSAASAGGSRQPCHVRRHARQRPAARHCRSAPNQPLVQPDPPAGQDSRDATARISPQRSRLGRAASPGPAPPYGGGSGYRAAPGTGSEAPQPRPRRPCRRRHRRPRPPGGRRHQGTRRRPRHQPRHRRQRGGVGQRRGRAGARHPGRPASGAAPPASWASSPSWRWSSAGSSTWSPTPTGLASRTSTGPR